MVVLIVGISLAGYIAYKFLGERAGVVLKRSLGGSGFEHSHHRSQRPTGQGPADRRRRCLHCHCAGQQYGLPTNPPGSRSGGSEVLPKRCSCLAVVMLGLTLLPASLEYLRLKPTELAPTEQRNPSELRSARLFFGAMYLVVAFALAIVQRQVAPEYLYVVAGLSGLTDMDAITLSTARMCLTQGTDSWIAQHGWRVLLVAALSNLVFKWTIATLLGGFDLARRLAWMFSVPFVGRNLIGSPLAVDKKPVPPWG